MKKAPSNNDDRLDRLATVNHSSKPSSIGSLGLIVIAVVVSVVASLAIQNGLGKQTNYAKLEKVSALQDKITQLEARLTEREKQIELLMKAYPVMNNKIANTSGAAMQRIMIQQESNIQSFLKNLKSGMYDLAHMIPGSRTWLEYYNESMNGAIQKSIERSRRLKRLNSGAILIEPDAR